MRRILLVINLLLCFIAKSQVYQSMPQYGYGPVKRFDIDSSLTIPTTCGVPTLRTTLTKKSAIAFDSCNNKFYRYNPKTHLWNEVGGSSLDTTSLSNRINSKADTSALNVKLNSSDTIYLSNRINNKLNSSDTTSLSNRINLKLNISDTANKWVNNIYRKSGNDSIFYQIGTTEYKIKDSVGGSSQNGRFGNDTATIVMAKIHNDAGIQLTNGMVVRWSTSGTNSDAPSVRLANNKHDSTSANTIGFVSGTIAVNDTGYVILSGKIEKLNTSAFSNGDIIYLDSTSGQWTKNKPVAPLHMVYLGVIVKANAGNGSIFVKAQNGYELDEIHDVLISSKLNNQVLVYSDTQKVWKNRNIYSIVDTTSLSNRINLKQNTLTNPITGTGTNGSIAKFNGTTTLTNATADVDYLQQDLTTIALQSLGSSVKSFNIGYQNPLSYITQQALSNQVMRFIAVYVPKSATITGVKFYQTTTGVYTASNYNGVGLYSYSSTDGTLTLVASSTNDGTIWSSAGANLKSKAFSSTYSASAGVYFIGLLYSSSAQTTAPQLATNGTGTFGTLSSFDFTNSAKLAGTLNAQTSLPATQLSSGITAVAYGFAVWLY